MLNELNKEKKQKYFLYLTSIFRTQAFSDAVFVILYLRHLNITFEDYLLLDLILFICIALFEIPSGFIADYFGRKLILILGKFMIILSMFILLIFHELYGGIISVIIYSIGSSLSSGNVESLMYEWFTKIDRLDKYKKYLADSTTIGLWSLSLYSILSGIIIKYSTSLVIILDISFMIINLIVTCIFLMNTKIKHKVNNIEKIQVFKDVKNLNLERTKIIVISFIILTSIFTFFRVTYTFYQPLYEFFDIPIQLIGFFPIIFNIIASFGSQIYKKLIVYKLSLKSQMNIIIFILFTSSIIFIFFRNIYIFFAIILTQQIIRGYSGPFSNIAYNDSIPQNTKYRTTYISIYSLVNTLSISIMLLLSKKVLRHFSLTLSMAIIGIIILVLIAILNNFYNYKRGGVFNETTN